MKQNFELGQNLSKLFVITIPFSKANTKVFFFISLDIREPMKHNEQFYTCLNEVLLLKLLQIVAICHNTNAWVNFFVKKTFIVTRNSFF